MGLSGLGFIGFRVKGLHILQKMDLGPEGSSMLWFVGDLIPEWSFSMEPLAEKQEAVTSRALGFRLSCALRG